jgi:sn-glycerol 3-phosphate transport system permease protein
VIQFIYGWNQYLWPLLITTEDKYADHRHGHPPDPCAGRLLTEWQMIMAMAVLAMLPPVLVVVLMQRWFVKGLVETEK